MSHPSDAELDRRLAEARPVPPAGFTDAVMRRAAEARPGSMPIPVPVPATPRRGRWILASGGLLVAAAALVLLILAPRHPAASSGWRVTAGASLPRNGLVEVAPDGYLRLERGDGAALELAGGAQGEVLDDVNFLLQHGRARLEGAVTVTTPRARVVGAAADALAELNLESQENPMILKSTSILAAAAAGSVLTVAVLRGEVAVHSSGPTPTLSMKAGERTTVPAPDDTRVVAAATEAASRALSSPAAASAPAAAADPECPAMAAGGSDCPEGMAPCANCEGGDEPPASTERVNVNIDGAPMLGPAGARVTIIEFADYQCPFCEKAMSTVHELAGMYPRDVRIVLKNFPMPGHKNARLAAEAALAAGEQGKYWEMHDLLLANQERLDRASVESYAAALGIDGARFKRSLDEGRFGAQVEKDIADATAIGLHGVPSFVINGRLVVGARPLDDFKQIVDEELVR